MAPSLNLMSPTPIRSPKSTSNPDPTLPPQAGEPLTISPFISSFELEAHFLASAPQTALDLIRLQWGFMLNDPRMTNSTFIEGYSADGSLHYAPYTNDPRVSHAHGFVLPSPLSPFISLGFS